MRVAMIGQKGIPATYGGVERHVEELSVRLAGHGCDVTVYSRRWFVENQKKIYRGVHVIFTPTIHTKHLDAIVHTFTSTVHALFHSYDIIHYHGVGPALLAWIPRVFSPRTTVVVTFQSIDRRHKKWGLVARWFLRIGEWAACTFAHKTIAISHTIAKYAEEVYDCKAAYIPNGINPQPPENTDALIQKKFHLKKDDYILTVTRLIPHKGVHFLIKAFRSLSTTKKLVITGGSAFTDSYVQHLHELAGDDDRIIFTGFQSGKTLHQLFSNAAIIVQPTEAEGLSIALLESMNYGRPLLVSDIEENKEALGSFGWYFQSGNTVDLRKKLAALLKKSPKEREARAKRAQHYVRIAYNWETIAEKTKTLYDSLVTEKTPAHEREYRLANK